MGKSVNQVILMGRLTKDVEVRATTTGKSVGSFTLAVDKAGSQEGADFFDVVAWEKLAELLEQYTSKGSKVLVLGRIQQESWDDKDSGKKRSKVVVVASDVTFLDSKQSPNDNGKNATDVDEKPVDLSEIPF